MNLTAEGLAAAMPVWWASYLQNAARWALSAPAWLPAGIRRLPLRFGVYLADRKLQSLNTMDSIESNALGWGPRRGRGEALTGGMGAAGPHGNGGEPMAPTRSTQQVVGKGVER